MTAVLKIDGKNRHSHPLYKTWRTIHAACYQPNNSGYKGAGARGVKVCERWHDFDNFVKDIKRRPKNKRFCRINVTEDYGPKNYFWKDVTVKKANSKYSQKSLLFRTREDFRSWFKETFGKDAFSKETSKEDVLLYKAFKGGVFSIVNQKIPPEFYQHSLDL